MRNLLLSDIMVGVIMEFNLWVEVHDHEETKDEEPLFTVSVIIKRYSKTGKVFVLIDDEQNEDVSLTKSEKYDIIKRVEDDIEEGLIKLPKEVDFDSSDMSFILFK